jgi:hypothetical protein
MVHIVVLDFDCLEVDFIDVTQEVLNKFGEDDSEQVENFLYGYCGYNSDVQFMVSESETVKVNHLQPEDFGGGDVDAWIDENL